LAEDVQLRRRGEVEHVLQLGHERDLAGPVREMHALLLSRDLIAVEVCRSLLKLGEVFNGSQRSLRPMNLLVEDAAQAYRVQPESMILRSSIRIQVERRVGMAIDVTIQAAHAEAWFFNFSVFGLVELLLRKWSQQQPQTI